MSRPKQENSSANNSTSEGMASGPQQPPTQEALHVAATVCNQLHDDTPFLDSIDQPVRLEKDLSKPGDAKIGKLARMAPALREFCKAGQRLLDEIGRAHV